MARTIGKPSLGPKWRRRGAKAGLFVAVAAALSACVSLLPESNGPEARYRLLPPQAPAEAAPTVSWQLVVDSPVAPRALDTELIAITRSPLRYEYFAGVEWADRAPNLFQDLLIQGFENSGKIVAVGRRSSGLRGDLVLQSSLRRFEADFSEGRQTVRVALHVNLMKGAFGEIVASGLIESDIEARSRQPGAIVAAFDTAANDVVTRAVEWTLGAGARSRGGV